MKRLSGYRLNLLAYFMVMILSHEIAWGENAVPAHTISKSELAWLQKNWATDGYWYFYAKGDPKRLAPILTYVRKDRSDVMLESRESSIWINSRRPPTPDEMYKKSIYSYYPRFAADPPQTVCDRVTVNVTSNGNAGNRDILGSKVVIRDIQGNELKSFALFRKYAPPSVLMGYFSEDHSDETKPLIVPIESSAFAIAALEDCTFLVRFTYGVVRFTVDGMTQAKLPVGMRLIYGDEILQLNREFDQDFPFGSNRENLGVSLQARLRFFDRKIFPSY